MQKQKTVCFPFPGKTLDESLRKFSGDWSYSFPLLLKPIDGNKPLTDEMINEIQKEKTLNCKLLKDGRVLSLNDETSCAFFENGYTIDVTYLH